MTSPLTNSIARPEILDSIPAAGHVVIEASAGTGKTYTLESLVAHLIQTGAATLSEILIVTFTEKAKEELRGRLRRRLETLASHPQEAWPLDNDEGKRLEAATHDFESSTLSTIHGFCRKVLEENAFHQSRLFEEQLVDGAEQFRVAFRRRIRHTLVAEDRAGEQLRHWLREGNRLSTLEQLTWKVSRERGEITPQWDPQLLLSAAQSLLELLPQAELLLPRAAGQVHGAGAIRTLGNFLRDLGLLMRRLVAGEDSFELHPHFLAFRKRVLVKMQVVERLESTSWPSAEARVVSRELCDALFELGRYWSTREAFLASRLATDVTRELHIRKTAEGKHDFDDLLTLLRDAVAGEAGAPLVATLRERYRMVLIDESQDTDEVQWDIFRRVFFDQHEGHRIFLVGDPKQAIYGFRNADVETYRRAKEEVREAGGVVLELRRNYRSTAALVKAQNALFRNYFDGGIDYLPIDCGRPEMSTEGIDGESVPPIGLLVASDKEEATQLPWTIADEVRRLVLGGTVRLHDGTTSRRVRFSDIQILTRSGDEALQVGAALESRSVPFAYYRQEGLYSSREAEDLAALFRAIARPGDQARRHRAWLTPFFGVHLRDVARLEALASGTDGHPALLRLYRWHAMARGGNLTQLFQSLMDDSGVVRRALFDGDAERQIINYRHLLEDLLAEGNALGEDVRELPARMSRLQAAFSLDSSERDTQRLTEMDSAVQILTIHKAKGLEAAVVFLMGGWTRPPDDLRIYHRDGKRHANLKTPGPAVVPLTTIEALSEAQRLGYVAVTRAQFRLYLPLYGKGVHERSLQGPLQKRLQDLRSSPMGAGLFEEVAATPSAKVTGTDQGQTPRAVDLASWRPSAKVEDRLWTEDEFDRLRRKHAAASQTSYTQLTRHRFLSSGTDDDEASEELGLPITPLPGGREVGIFLHELLERLEYSNALAAADGEELFTPGPAQRLFRHFAHRHGIPPEGWPEARAILFAALRTPIEQPGLQLDRGLAQLQEVAKESEFLFPMVTPNGGQAPDTPSGLAFVQGVVDLLFEHGGRYFVADWKSDRRSDWSFETLHRHVADHYTLQARLYAIAAGRLLEIQSKEDYEARFGGLLYCFLRGMDPLVTNQGTYFKRPTWESFCEWNDLSDLQEILGGGAT